MPSENPLDNALEHYNNLDKCLRIVLKIVRSGRSNNMDGIKQLFSSLNEKELLVQLEKTKEELASIFILYSWAFFERYIIEDLQKQSHPSVSPESSSFQEQLCKSMDDAIERWRMDDILEIDKSKIDGHVVGLAKPIKSHRDFPAHRNPNKKPDDKPISPSNVHKQLSDIINHLETREEELSS